MQIQNAPIIATIFSIFLHTLASSAQVPNLNPIPNSLSAEAREYLLAHNEFRKRVNVPPLQWDEKLANFARAWAVMRINDCDHHHHSKGPYGENLFWELYDEKNPDDIVKVWFDEQKNYDHPRSACNCVKEDDKCMCGHYTQLVWSNTQRVGCANVTCNNDKGTYIVCSYDPPGNYPGKSPFEKHINVQSPPSGPTPTSPSSNPPPVQSPQLPSIPIPTTPTKLLQSPQLPSIPIPTMPTKLLQPPQLPSTPTLPNRHLPPTIPKMPLHPTTPNRLRRHRTAGVHSPAARVRNRLRKAGLRGPVDRLRNWIRRRNRLARMNRQPAAHV